MKCRFCGTDKELHVDATVHKKTGRVYKYYACRTCTTKRLIEYRKTENGKIATKKANKKYASLNPVRAKSWNRVQYPITEKKMELQPCAKCGKMAYP